MEVMETIRQQFPYNESDVFCVIDKHIRSKIYGDNLGLNYECCRMFALLVDMLPW